MEEMSPSDVILVENFDPHDLVFERAAALHKVDLAARALVPTDTSRDPERTDLVSRGITELMVRVARLQEPAILPIRIFESISLNAAYQIRDFLTKEHLRAVIVVIDGFRSQRSLRVYRGMLAPAGIKVGCAPVFGQPPPRTGRRPDMVYKMSPSSFFKLQYYSFYILWTPLPEGRDRSWPRLAEVGGCPG